MAWISKKIINFKRTSQMLQHCQSTNIFTNQGQYVSKLEDFIRNKFKISDNKSIICTCNATLALWCLCDSISIKQKRSLQWTTQSFTFPPSAQGLLQKTHIVDIDKEGGLDLTLVPDDTDGIIVTNVFGNIVDIDKYTKWAKQHDKFIVFDNAATAYTFYKGINSCNYGNGSIISFHHTKPFGFGEGGAIIIDKEYEQECRRLINFGIHNHLDLPWNRLGGNYKMSEISAIYILSFLQDNFDIIVKHHINMYKKYCNLYPMYPNFGDKDMSVLSCLCFFDKKFDQKYIDQLIKQGIHCRKYYKPLLKTKVAELFYKNILCHPLTTNIYTVDI